MSLWIRFRIETFEKRTVVVSGIAAACTHAACITAVACIIAAACVIAVASVACMAVLFKAVFCRAVVCISVVWSETAGVPLAITILSCSFSHVVFEITESIEIIEVEVTTFFICSCVTSFNIIVVNVFIFLQLSNEDLYYLKNFSAQINSIWVFIWMPT